jgi:hypothetical protein
MARLARNALGFFVALASLWVAGSPASAQTTFSKWISVTPDQRQFSAQPGGVMPLQILGGAAFAPGQYMVYVARSHPDGLTVSQWNTFGPFDLQGADKWAAYLQPQSQLRMEKNPAALLPYAGPGPAGAMIYVRNTDISSWQSICVLPVGMSARPDCFCDANRPQDIIHVLAPWDTRSRWTSITPDQRQNAAQPGGLFPLNVVVVCEASSLGALPAHHPHVPPPHSHTPAHGGGAVATGGAAFVAGPYMIYVANSDPAGQTVSKWNTFGPIQLQSNDKWAAYLLPQARVRLDRNSAATMRYSDPGPNRAMIYVRNSEIKSWQSICVLPVGKSVQPDCFGGSSNVVYDVKGKPAGIEGTYAGKVTLRQRRRTSYGLKTLPVITGTIKLTVTKGQISGSMTIISANARQEAAISGQVSADGRITASVQGKSEYTGSWSPSGPADLSGAIEKIISEFQIRGSLSGAIADNRASGSLQAQGAKGDTVYRQIDGTWQASLQTR